MKGDNALIIGIGKAMGKKSPMGSSKDDDDSEEKMEADSFEESLDAAVQAMIEGDKDTAKDALSAAIAAKCADLMEEAG